MARHFMAALGNSSMEKKEYIFKEEEPKKFDYVQEAILHYTGGADKITVFLTEAAKEKWVEDGGLKASLEKKYKDAIKEVYIDDGNNDDELMNIFTKIYEKIDENDEVIFDITNGYRTLPMLVFTVINYARALKNITVEGIYYGAYIEGKSVEQILDLSIYMDIMETAFAANYFVSYGNAKRFNELVNNAKNRYAHETKNNKKEGSEDHMFVLARAIDKLKVLTECINTCRGKYFEKKKKSSIKAAYDTFKLESEKILGKTEDKKEKPFELIFKYAKKKVDHYFANADNDFKTGMATIQWCIDYGLVQQGLTALRETIVTYAYEKLLFPGEGYDQDKRICTERALSYIKNNKEDRKNGDGLAADTDNIEQLNAKLMKKKSACTDKNKNNKDLCEIYKKVGQIRNDINHFGFNNSPTEFKNFNENLKSYYKEFKEYIKCQED